MDSYENEYLEEGNNKNKVKKFWKKYGLDKTMDKSNGIIHSVELIINNQEIINSSTVEKAKISALEQIEMDKYSEKFRENWKKLIEKLISKEQIVNFMKEEKEKFDNKITWIHCNLEIFLFGEKSENNKEYNVISQKNKILEILKENNSAKIKELKKIFSFLD